MKKLIAIMTIAIVLVGAVFADEAAANANGSAQITIQTCINEQFPAYKLKATGVTTGSLSGENGAGSESAVAASNPTKGLVTVTTDYLLDHDATVNFSIIQTKKSITIHVYNIGVTASDLVMTKKSDGSNYTPATANTYDEEHKFVCSTPNPAINTGNIAHAVVSGTNAGTATQGGAGAIVTYDGQKVAADVTIATFSCSWTQQEKAAAGTYEATVTLTVVAE